MEFDISFYAHPVGKEWDSIKLGPRDRILKYLFTKDETEIYYPIVLGYNLIFEFLGKSRMEEILGYEDVLMEGWHFIQITAEFKQTE